MQNVHCKVSGFDSKTDPNCHHSFYEGIFHLGKQEENKKCSLL